MAWTLEHAGTTKTFADWGFSGLRRTTVSATTDLVTFKAPVNKFDDDTALQPDAKVKIYRDGVKWFEGIVTQTPLTAQADAESHGYVVSGPWYHFEDNVYKQPWLSVGGVVNIGHILMNITVGHALFPTNLQMRNICEWVISLFPGDPPFQIGTISPIAYPPVSEVNAITCAAAMRSQLRWIPDAMVWFDYATSPPTLHVRKRSELTPVSVTIPDSDLMDCTIVPRYDLIRPSISIHYEINSVVDGKNQLGVSFDIWPPGATGDEPGALNIAINLQGPTRNRSYAELLCDTINTSALLWWQNHLEALKDPRYSNIAITGVTRTLEDGSVSASYPRELIEGQITDWMGYDWQQEIITGKISFTYTVDGAKQLEVKEQVVSVRLVSTDATTGEYENVTTDDIGDPMPVGLARFLYEALSVLHFDGQFSLVEEEVTGQVTVGNAVNLAGGRAAWASMNALVQSITEDVDQGITRVTVGPPKHLGHDDLMELLRVGRRRRWTPTSTQETGELGDVGETQLGKPTANRNTSPGREQTQYLQIQDGTTATTYVRIDAPNKLLWIHQSSGRDVSIDLDDIPAGAPAASMPLKIREVEVCVNNVTRRMLVIGSADYAAPP